MEYFTYALQSSQNGIIKRDRGREYFLNHGDLEIESKTVIKLGLVVTYGKKQGFSVLRFTKNEKRENEP